jgi:hypothetical protein
MDGNLGTTNILLGIMAAISVLEGLLLIGLGIAGFKVYRAVMELVRGIEERQVAPAMAKVNALLDQANAVATTVRTDTERVEQAIRSTIDRVDGTAHRVRDNVRTRASWIAGTIRGIRDAIEHMLRSDRGPHASASDYVRTH